MDTKTTQETTQPVQAVPASIEVEIESSESTKQRSAERPILAIRDLQKAKQAQQDTEKQSPETKTEQSEKVVFTPEQQEKFDNIYRQLKGSDKNNKQLRSELNQFRMIAEQQYKAIEDLTKSQNQIVGHLQERDLNAAEASIKAEIKAAFLEGDNDKWIAASEKLADLKAESAFRKAKLAEQNALAKQQQQQQQQQWQPRNASEIAQRAEANGSIASEEKQFVDAWQKEKDENGELLRPWAYADHPKFQQAVSEARLVFDDPDNAGMGIQQKLDEVDRKMRLKKQQSPSQNVLGGNLTSGKKSVKIQLSPEQIQMAKRLRVAGTKASDEDHIRRYAQQLERMKQGGGNTWNSH